jgi:AbrB family looped-hinge helix DNA binding protein
MKLSMACHGGIKKFIVNGCRVTLKHLVETSGEASGRRSKLTLLHTLHSIFYLKTMATVALSPRFQVVIPKDIRRALQLVPGQRMAVRLNEGKVEFTPEKTIASLRGRWPGMDTQVLREVDRA